MRITNREEFFGCLVFYEAIGGALLAVGLAADPPFPWIGAIWLTFFTVVGVISLPDVLRESRYYVDIGGRCHSNAPSTYTSTYGSSSLPAATEGASPWNDDGDQRGYDRGDGDHDRCRICGDRAEVGPYCGPDAP